MLIKLDYLMWIGGLILAAVAYLSARDASNPRRWTSGLFWGIFALIYLLGDRLPPIAVGALVVAMALLAGLGGVGKGQYRPLPSAERLAQVARLGNRLFVPILSISVIAMLGSLLMKDVKLAGYFVLDPKNLTLVSAGLGALLALAGGLLLTRDRPAQPLHEARRLLEAMGWAVMLPQMLATLGLLFTDAGVGSAVAHLTTSAVAVDNRLVAVAAYAIGMALFTIIMGNAFAAFPVMTAGIGIPILLGVHHGNPAVMAAIGMFCGYCGTLLTPMAANFNIIPAALLELPDKNAVIRAQWPTAVMLLIVNIGLMYFLMFR
ncbi:MAG: DUF979 domain-containing protein [Burkholderiales bacterium]|nr:DUF979 domain-containing protein [Burkholderiales bacterium]